MSGNTSIGNSGFKVLAKAIINEHCEAERVGKGIILRKLNLSYGSIDDNKLIVLGKALPYIQEVDLSRNVSIGNAGLEVIAKAIISEQGAAEREGKNIALRKLDLSSCVLDKKELMALAKSPPYIQEVDFSEFRSIGNAEFDVQTKTIIIEQGEAEKGDKSIALKKHDLFDCSVDEKKLIAFAKALSYVQEVDLSKIRSILNAGFEVLAKAIMSEQDETEKRGKNIALKKT